MMGFCSGKNHAGHIGTMALELVKCMETFVMPHLPAEQIRMRVGLHSGKVIYVLFKIPS